MRTFTRSVACTIAFVVAAATFARTGPAHASVPDITGTITVSGCEMRPDDIEVGAIPMEVSRSADAAPDPGDAPIVTSDVERTGTGTFTFALSDLLAGHPYLVGPRVTGGGCSFVSGEIGRVVMPGDTVELAVTAEEGVRRLPIDRLPDLPGRIPAPQLPDLPGRIPAPQPPSVRDLAGKLRKVPVGPGSRLTPPMASLEVHEFPWPVFADTPHPDRWRQVSYITKGGYYQRTFRSFALASHVVRARWEIGRLPMGGSCEAPAGVITAGTVDYTAGHVQFEVDFKDVVALDEAQRAAGVPVAAGGKAITAAKSGEVIATMKGTIGGAGPATVTGGGARKAVKQNDRPMRENRDTYFVRVVPLAADGSCAGQTSNRVTVQLQEPKQTPPVTFPVNNTAVVPKLIDYTSFSLGTVSPARCYIATANQPWPGWIKDGEKFCLWPKAPSSPEWYEVVTGWITSGIEWVGSAVDWVATAWEDIQAFVVNVAASVIDAIPGIECNSECRAGLKYGLKAGLQAMGIPPTIPNFKQLVEQGEDYLIDQMVEEAGLSDVPFVRDKVEQAIDTIVAKAVASQSSSSNGGLGWARLDPYYLPHPASVVVEASYPVNAPAGHTGNAKLCVTSQVYADACTSLKLAWGETKRIPLVLEARSLKLAHFAPNYHPQYLSPNAISKSDDGKDEYWHYQVPRDCSMDSGVAMKAETTPPPAYGMDGGIGNKHTTSGVSGAPCRTFLE